MALLSVIRRWHFRDELSIREIARRTGLSRSTIRKYLRLDGVEPKFKVPDRPSKLDPFAEKLSGWLETLVIMATWSESELLAWEELAAARRVVAARERQQLLASNLANVDTPHYKPVDMEFEGALRDALGGAAGARRRRPRAIPTPSAGKPRGRSRRSSGRDPRETSMSRPRSPPRQPHPLPSAPPHPSHFPFRRRRSPRARPR